MTDSPAAGGAGGQLPLETNDNTSSKKKVPSSNVIHHQQQAATSQIVTQAPAPCGRPPIVRPAPVNVAISTAVPRRARPLRPNLVRQVVVAAPDNAARAIPIELGQLGASQGLTRPMVPPKRPAHLPARYETLHRGIDAVPAVASAASAATSGHKPNRYSSWATHMAHPVDSSTFPGHLSHPQPAGTHHAPLDQDHHPSHHHFSLPFEAASRVLVVNPMQIVNLSEHTKSRLIKIIEALKRFSEQWFSHVLLLMFLAVYACLGAYVFISFEAPTEQWEKQLIIDTRQRLVNETWQDAHKTGDGAEKEFINTFRTKLEEYERLLNRACASGMTSSSLENQWTFWGALFYSMTVFTTIGYGHLTPITFAGRVATMVYAIFGIPILLMVLADLGKLLTRIIKYAFKKFRLLFNKLLHRKTSIRTRKMISDNTSQYIGVARDAFERGFAHIQPYNRFPHAFTRAGSIGRRFYPAAHHHQHQHHQQKHPELVDPDAATNQTAEQSEHVYAEPAPGGKDPGQEAMTDVIVTPSKQTKPVSPQPSSSDTLSKKNPLAPDNLAHHDHQHNNNHHSSSQTSGRASSPAAPGGRRKGSLMGSSSGQRKTSGNHNATKNSMSRSASSSVVATTNHDKAARLANKAHTAANSPTGQPGPLTDEKQQQSPPSGAEPSSQADAMENEDEPNVDDLGVLEDEEDEILDEFDIPVSFALFLLVTYMMFGAVVFSIWEGWNFFDSLYFVFISMSTIGFGDLVPQHPKRMIGTFIYLLFGLALTSMCINVVQEKIHATFLRAKMQIGEKMGLDLDQIMADDYYDGSTVMDGDECDDFNSAANLSQTNSTTGHCVPGSEDASQDTGDGKHSTNLEHSASESVLPKQARNKDSLRGNKRRPMTGLPAHNGPLLRRSQSKKGSSGRVSSPPVSSHSHSVEPPLGSQPVALALQQQPALKIALAENNKESPATCDAGGERAEKGNLDSRAQDKKNNLSIDIKPQFATIGSQLPRSRSSDVRHDGGRNSVFETRPASAAQARGHARSAGSSRRTSVSQELNELDDLILKLSQCQSNQERFGPLLGIPSSGSRLASRSNSPANNLLGSAHNSRRGTSMTYRPSNLNLPGVVTSDATGRKRSLQARPSNYIGGDTLAANKTTPGGVRYSAV